MRQRKVLIIAILMMVVGFAAVSTTMYINGLTTISKNEIFVDDIVFIKADISNQSKVNINNTGKVISFSSKILDSLGDKIILDYTIANYNRQYDANVVVNVKMKDESSLLNEYIKITNSLMGEFTLNAQSEKNGRLEIELVKLYTGESNIKVEFTIEYQVNGIERNGLANQVLNRGKFSSGWLFEYSGEEEIFLVPLSGVYKLEVWGAQGGSIYGGYGGYSFGQIDLKEGQKIYVNVGGTTSNYSPGYNGGGIANYTDVYQYSSFGGGGATHMSLSSGLLRNLSENINDILLVAGGGGGANETILYGGAGGGITGNNGNGSYYGTAGNQTTGGVTIGAASSVAGSFGQGGDADPLYPSNKTRYYAGGGGGGFYGGGGGSWSVTPSYAGSGGGGSGYIANELLENKAMYCYHCEESSEESTKTISTTNVSEEPISNYAKLGNGYAKITYLRK